MGTRAAILSQFFMSRPPIGPDSNGKSALVEEGSDRSREEKSDGGGTRDQDAFTEADGDGFTDADTASVASGSIYYEPVYKMKHRYLPIVSGLVCPFSVLLDIPGLTERWYIRTTDHGVSVLESQPNPILLDVALAASTFFGLVANIGLITRFLEKHPRVSTLIAIFALTIHDIINVTTVTVFGVVHRFNDGFTYGDAYWMCVASTVCSLVCNVTLVMDLVRTKEFAKNGSGLTEKQRSLVIAVMCLLCYIGLGSLCFSFLIPDLTYINSLYFTIVTIATVGFGDIVPVTVGARIFSFFYDTAGFILLAFTIAIARETVIETFEASYRARREVLAQKAKARKEEKRKRAKARKERLEREKLEDPVSFQNRYLKTNGQPAASGSRGGAGLTGKAQREADWLTETQHGVTAGKAWVHRFLRKIGLMKALTPPGSDGDLAMERSLTAQSILAEDSYKQFRKEVQREQDKEFQLKLAIALSLFVSFWMVGSMVFHFTEGWTYFEALYFCFVFFTTLGYGDFYPKTSSGRAFFVAWSILGIATMTLLLSVVTETWSSRYHSTISDSKVKRTIKRVGTARNPNSPSGASKLLEVEGFMDPDNIDVKDIPTRFTDAVKGFHEHARYFMHGRTGDTPESLRSLIDAADEFEEELEQLKESGDLETGHGETRHFLFMVSYERTFDNLLEAADRLKDVFQSHAGELEEMRRLNDELRVALAEAKASPPPPPPPPPSHLPAFPFGVRRPPGGDGDDVVEEALIHDVETDEPESYEDDRSVPTAVRQRHGTISGADLFRITSKALGRISTSTISRVPLRRTNTGDNTPTSETPPPDSPFMSDSSPITPTSSTQTTSGMGYTMTRQPTLTFAEPTVKTTKQRSRSASTAMSRVGESRSRKNSAAIPPSATPPIE